MALKMALMWEIFQTILFLDFGDYPEYICVRCAAQMFKFIHGFDSFDFDYVYVWSLLCYNAIIYKGDILTNYNITIAEQSKNIHFLV